MKRQNYLSASLLLNLMLLGAVVVLAKHPSFRNPPILSVSTPATPQAQDQSVSLPISLPTKPPNGGWSQWIASMRANGIPEKMIAQMAAADFEARWQQRQREARNQFAHGEVTGDALNLLNAQHDDDLEKEMLATLGPDSFRQWDKTRILEELNLPRLNLSTSEEDALYQLRKQYNQQTRKLELANQQGEIDAASYEEQSQAGKSQYNQELKQLIGDENYTALQNNSDSSAGNLRRGLLGISLSDQQFNTLAEAQQQWQDATTKLEQQQQQGNLKDHDQQIQTIKAARDQQFQQVLGADGFAQYQEKQDASYQTLQHYKNAWQLSDGDVDYLYQAIHTFQSQVQDYETRALAAKNQGQSVDLNDVQQNIEQFGRETGTSLQTYLGENRFNLLQRNNIFGILGD